MILCGVEEAGKPVPRAPELEVKCCHFGGSGADSLNLLKKRGDHVTAIQPRKPTGRYKA
jgi:hypothetical protein